jgi:hypothetical protein
MPDQQSVSGEVEVIGGGSRAEKLLCVRGWEQFLNTNRRDIPSRD